MTKYRTRTQKSKPSVLFAAFLVGSSAFLPVKMTFAQSVSNELRGAIELPTGPQLPGQTASQGVGLQLPRPTAAQQRAQLIQTRAIQRNVQQRATPAEVVGSTSNQAAPSPLRRQNRAVYSPQMGEPAAPEDDSFAPTGFRLGTFDVNLSSEHSVGHSDNISGEAGGNAGGFTQTDVNLGITSNWSRHQLQANLSGSYMKPFDSNEIDRPSGNAEMSLRLDLIDGFTATASGFYTLTTQDFTSTTLAPGAVDNPFQSSQGGSLELQRTNRKLQLTLRGSIEKDTYDDADLGGGVTQSQQDRNNTDYGISARVGYELSPALTPFVQAGYTLREYELTTDRNGNQRDSVITDLRGGFEFDLSEKLQGEISVGSITESFDDPNLADLTGLSVNAELNWSPSRETLVGLTLGTQTNSSITANENGSIIYNARLDFERQINHRLSMNAFADLQLETNDDNNRTNQFGIGIEYWINRFAALTADVEYEKFKTDAANSSFDALSARVGVKFQR